MPLTKPTFLSRFLTTGSLGLRRGGENLGYESSLGTSWNSNGKKIQGKSHKLLSTAQFNASSVMLYHQKLTRCDYDHSYLRIITGVAGQPSDTVIAEMPPPMSMTDKMRREILLTVGVTQQHDRHQGHLRGKK
ncbi:hypothetical protein PsorP6_015214 [Peronosclerospora sorghi]|uniref:Uncharacterized protein n=1 Tax=Peronosclerospora sorghi TaxID=230839 RepID=A0ACC0VRA0_9STRA|nr:hypothetical protein PsorP6_015214 [Peronosclerospora sorghi]